MSRWECVLMVFVAIYMMFLSYKTRRRFLKEVVKRTRGKLNDN